MQIMGKPRINSRSANHTNKRQPISKSDNASFVAFLRTVLDEGVDWTDEESPGKPKSGKKNKTPRKAKPRKENSQRNRGPPPAAKGNEALFIFPRRQQACCVAPHADPDGQRRLEIAAVRFVKVQDFSPVKHNHELQQGSQKPEISIANDGQMQYAIGAHELKLFLQVAKNIEAEFLRRVRGRHFGNCKAGG